MCLDVCKLFCSWYRTFNKPQVLKTMDVGTLMDYCTTMSSQRKLAVVPDHGRWSNHVHVQLVVTVIHYVSLLHCATTSFLCALFLRHSMTLALINGIARLPVECMFILKRAGHNQSLSIAVYSPIRFRVIWCLMTGSLSRVNMRRTSAWAGPAWRGHVRVCKASDIHVGQNRHVASHKPDWTGNESAGQVHPPTHLISSCKVSSPLG